MRRACLEMVYELAKQDDRIFFIGSDLGPGTLANFQAEMPERFFMEGISEANIIGIAAGLAMEGKIVYVNTIATFLTRRCYEQIALDLCLHNTNVRLIGNGGGLVYGPLGPTHQAIEDIGLMGMLPNMTVIAPADAEEIRRLMPATVEHQGPIYIRLAKGGDAIVTQYISEQALGKAAVLREGHDVLLVTTGVSLQIALEAAEKIQSEGISSTVLHFATVKPFDSIALMNHVEGKSVVCVLEEHVPSGGLGSAVAETMLGSGLGQLPRFIRIGLEDEFVGGYGSQHELMGLYGLSVDGVVDKIIRITAIGTSRQVV